MLCQLNLHLPLARTGVPSEHVQDQRGSVDDLVLQRRFQVTLLSRRQLVIADYDIGTFLFQQLLEFLKLAFPNVGGSVPVGPLPNDADHFGAGGTRQVVKFNQRIFHTPQVFDALPHFRSNQHRPLSLRAGCYHLAGFGHSTGPPQVQDVGDGMTQFSNRWHPVSTRSSGVVSDNRM